MSKESYIKIRTNGIPNVEELAKEYDMQAKDFVAYHNSHCALTDILPLQLPKFVEYLYIPLEKYKARQERLLQSNRLYLPENSSEKEYGVVIKHQSKDLQIHYQVAVKRSEQSITVEKNKTYVNNHAIDKVVEQLYEKAEQALYPLELLRNPDGSISGIGNSKVLEKRWQEVTLPNLQQYYQSSVSDRILSQMSQIFSQLEYKVELLQRNLFFKLFFLPLYRLYPKKVFKETIQVYFSPLGRNISYQTTWRLNPEYTRSGKIVLQIEGVEEEDFLNKDKDKGTISLLYKLNKETEELFSIVGHIAAFENGQELKIDFQLYELKTKNI